MTSIVSPRLMTKLSGFFNATCTIKTAGGGENTAGEPLPSDFDDLVGHVDIPCRIAPARGERRGVEYTVATYDLSILLQGHFPSIRPSMHVKIVGDELTIVDVKHDSENSHTELACNRGTI